MPEIFLSSPHAANQPIWPRLLLPIPIPLAVKLSTATAPTLRHRADCACGYSLVHHASGCLSGCLHACQLAQ